MILKESFLNVIDDSGVSKVKVLRNLQGKKYATLKDLVKVSIRKRFYNTSIVKRTLCIGLIVTVRRKYRRLNGICFKQFQNNLVLLNDEHNELLLNKTLQKNVKLLPTEILRFKGVNLRFLVKNVI